MPETLSDFESPAEVFSQRPPDPPKDAPVTSVQTTTKAAPVDSVAVAEPESDSEPEPESSRRPRHRARKDVASPADVPRIRELTAKFKQAEQERDAFKQRLDALESRPVYTPPVEKAEDPVAFTKPKPKLEQFGAEADPLDAWEEASAAWREDKKAHQAKLAGSKETQIQQATQQHEARMQTYYAKALKFAETQPDFQQAIESTKDFGNSITPILNEVILRDDNGPAFVYHLATHPEDLGRLFLDTDGKAVSDVAVGLAQRYLRQRVQTGTTGSVASPPVTVAPKPPNPVRSTAQTTDADPYAVLKDGTDFDTQRRVMRKMREKEGWGRVR